jgi:hypothetical protein
MAIPKSPRFQAFAITYYFHYNYYSGTLSFKKAKSPPCDAYYYLEVLWNHSDSALFGEGFSVILLALKL